MTYDEALGRMSALCSTGEHCESDVRQRLQRADVIEADIDRIIDYLYKEDYINDARYCLAFSRDKLRFQHWGRVKIEQALRLKGLPKASIAAALDELPQDEYEAILENALQQKARSIKADNAYTLRNKLLRFAIGRGFTMDESLRAIPSHLQEDDY